MVLEMGFFSNPSLRTSSALLWNLSEDRSIKALLLSNMYRSSLAGKLDERGTAMLLLPKMESHVTVHGEQRLMDRLMARSASHPHIHSYSRQGKPLSVHRGSALQQTAVIDPEQQQHPSGVDRR